MLLLTFAYPQLRRFCLGVARRILASNRRLATFAAALLLVAPRPHRRLTRLVDRAVRAETVVRRRWPGRPRPRRRRPAARRRRRAAVQVAPRVHRWAGVQRHRQLGAAERRRRDRSRVGWRPAPARTRAPSGARRPTTGRRRSGRPSTASPAGVRPAPPGPGARGRRRRGGPTAPCWCRGSSCRPRSGGPRARR